ASDEDRARIRELYRTSTLAADEGMAAFAAMLAHNGSLERATLIFSGDHGESLYDQLGIMGHGDQLGEQAGIEVPWIVFGKGRRRFDYLGDGPIESIRLSQRLLDAAGVPHDMRPSIPASIVYMQTGEWLAQTPNVPHERIRYPELSELLTIRDPLAQI